MVALNSPFSVHSSTFMGVCALIFMATANIIMTFFSNKRDQSLLSKKHNETNRKSNNGMSENSRWRIELERTKRQRRNKQSTKLIIKIAS